jgi:hypothetical protein
MVSYQFPVPSCRDLNAECPPDISPAINWSPVNRYLVTGNKIRATTACRMAQSSLRVFPGNEAQVICLCNQWQKIPSSWKAHGMKQKCYNTKLCCQTR